MASAERVALDVSALSLVLSSGSLMSRSCTLNAYMMSISEILDSQIRLRQFRMTVVGDDALGRPLWRSCERGDVRSPSTTTLSSSHTPLPLSVSPRMSFKITMGSPEALELQVGVHWN